MNTPPAVSPLAETLRFATSAVPEMSAKLTVTPPPPAFAAVVIAVGLAGRLFNVSVRLPAAAPA